MKNTLLDLQLLQCDAKISKDKHFTAAERKSSYNKKLGVSVILINVLIGSTLIEYFPEGFGKQLFISAISFFAASFAAIQTFFNFSKDVENHRKIGNGYLEVVREIDRLIASFYDGLTSEKSIQNSHDKLIQKYFKINKEAEVCPNAPSDYQKAFKKNKDTKESLIKLKEQRQQLEVEA
ncbi:SLATT domain-containing protein [Sediminitomix flava]|uniref:SMODS and SLOG-associating 2TM effector domain-containing protein n=1 Tax=Sediminitomix flava TaxID=379075 RepID=A0A315Z8L2_SEDFL|nr:SLATT domain-containing protein [Sediminitomix flava]PWJ40998.1 hypothetical protein BC781_104264 [Sediminitomix flava]